MLLIKTKMMKRTIHLFAVIIIILLTGCSKSDDSPRCFTCEYEERTTGCNSSTFGNWEAKIYTVDFELKEGLSSESFCEQSFPSNDIECASTCCVSFQFRNVKVGECP